MPTGVIEIRTHYVTRRGNQQVAQHIAAEQLAAYPFPVVVELVGHIEKQVALAVRPYGQLHLYPEPT